MADTTVSITVPADAMAQITELHNELLNAGFCDAWIQLISVSCGRLTAALGPVRAAKTLRRLIDIIAAQELGSNVSVRESEDITG